MPDNRHESQDLEDYDVDDASDTLAGNPGDDPLDRGVVAPDRLSAGTKYALRGEEESESLDELLSEEEPDIFAADDEASPDENATGSDVRRLARDEGAEPRAGRLVAPAEDTDDPGDTLLDSEKDEVARDAGIDGGGASAEEAAVHVIDEDDQ
jgi:Family of unknown function (DUF5709)